MLTEGVGLVGAVHEPLDEDHGDEISEEEEEEDQLGEELQEDVTVLTLAHFVPQAKVLSN